MNLKLTIRCSALFKWPTQTHTHNRRWAKNFKGENLLLLFWLFVVRLFSYTIHEENHKFSGFTLWPEHTGGIHFAYDMFTTDKIPLPTHNRTNLQRDNPTINFIFLLNSCCVSDSISFLLSHWHWDWIILFMSLLRSKNMGNNVCCLVFCVFRLASETTDNLKEHSIIRRIKWATCDFA